jgi:hypothetical protein
LIAFYKLKQLSTSNWTRVALSQVIWGQLYKENFLADFEDLFRRVAQRPGMYGIRTLEQYQSFLLGYNFALCEAPLLGLKEYFVKKNNGGNNLVYGNMEALVDGETEDERIRSWHSLLEEFFEARRNKGLQKIFVEHQKWLEEQNWYTRRSADPAT